MLQYGSIIQGRYCKLFLLKINQLLDPAFVTIGKFWFLKLMTINISSKTQKIIKLFDTSALDQNSLGQSFGGIFPLFFDQLGIVNIYKPLFGEKNENSLSIEPFLNLKFYNITRPRNVGLVMVGKKILTYCQNQGIEYILVDQASKVVAQQAQ
ncbi:hypothetical protein ABPG72_013267 [Tetrahymena utriculariae]